ncbi:PH domain-containing protein [Streptosporangium sp. NPDC051022]|uniref:PH domain-containing protein n=1 Tax=Streptosporangium sp. NPDC051022 TaxID=3155752 RepID=UPI00342DAB25
MSGPVLRWRVRRELLVVKVVAAVVFALLAVLNAGDPRGAILAGVVALVAAVLALRDILAPVRLSADGEGLVVVRGFVGSERIPWSAIERIRVDRRARFTSRTEFLEIDTGEAIFLLSRFDLGVPCQEAADELRSFRTGS